MDGSTDSASRPDASSQPATILKAGDAQGGSLILPEGQSLVSAEFQQDGADLVLTFPDGSKVVVEGYFNQPNPPTLVSADGAQVPGGVVVQMAAGPETKVAQAADGDALSAGTDNAAPSGSVIGQATAGTDGAAIGQVQNVSGTVVAIRVDGTRVTLEVGAQVYQGDILESAENGAVGIMLADQTTFSMGENGRMVLDEMIYDPSSQTGSVSMSVLQGVFTFVSGQVAKTDPDAMTLSTPVATIGIRGTQVGLDIPDGKKLNVVLMEEADGFVGEVVVYNNGGARVMNGANDWTVVRAFDTVPSTVQRLETGSLVETFATPLKHLPLLHGNQNDFGLQRDIQTQKSDAGNLANFETAAGPQQQAPTETVKVVEGNYAEAGSRIETVQVQQVQQTTVQEAKTTTTTQTVEQAQQPAPKTATELLIEQLTQKFSVPGVSDLQIMVDPVTGVATVTARVDANFEFPDAQAGVNFVLTGTDNINTIVTGAGTDTIESNGNNDVVDAGAGDDVIIGGAGRGIDRYIGGAGTDTLKYPSAGPDQGLIIDLRPSTIFKLADGTSDGREYGFAMDASLSEEMMAALLADPTAFSADAMLVNNEDGWIDFDFLYEIENVTGGQGDDRITGDDNVNILDGSLGDDTLAGGGGNDTLKGGAGDDVAVFSGNFEDYVITVDPGTGNLIVQHMGGDGMVPGAGADGTDIVSGFELLRFADIDWVPGTTIVGGEGEDEIAGGAGDDVLVGGGGNDVIMGGAGDDDLAGEDGDDILYGDIGNDTLSGGEGDDQLYGDAGNDILDGGAGRDTIDGGAGDDKLIGGGGNDVLKGGAGDDTLQGDGDDDDLSGDEGNDKLYGNAGNDKLAGGAGSDILEGGAGDDVLYGDDELGLVVGGDDFLYGGEGDDALYGGAGNDYLEGNDGDDILVGGEGDDVLVGGAGNDVLIGGLGNDRMEGGAGDDVFFAGLGDDVVDGGEGFDIVKFDGNFGNFSIEIDEQGVVSIVGSDGSVELNGIEQVEFLDQVFSYEQLLTPDVPVVGIEAAVGLEDTAIALNIGITANNPIPGETVSIVISDVPDGVTLSAGINNGDGTWTLTQAQLDGLTLTPGENESGNFELGVTVTRTGPTGQSSTTEGTLSVDVTAVADVPTLDLTPNAPGAEDSGIALDVSAFSVDSGETVSITISGVPEGASLSAGVLNDDGTWSLTPTQLAGLTITPPENSNEDFQVTVTAKSQDGDSTATTTGTIDVAVTGVADAPTLSVSLGLPIFTPGGVTGQIESILGTGSQLLGGTYEIPVDIDAALVDTDGSETLSITVSDLPLGATLSAGTQNPDGSWTLTPGQLDNLTLSVSVGAGETLSLSDVSLSVTATTKENDSDSTASTTVTAGVEVDDDASAPVVESQDAAGKEDTAIALDISAALADTDGSETLSIVISGIPEGAALSAGEKNEDGTWTLTSDQLEGLTVTPPHNSNVAFTLTVAATSTEVNGGATTTTTSLVDVDIQGVADPTTVSATLGEPEIVGGPLQSLTLTNMGQTTAAFHNTYGYYVLGDDGKPESGEIVFADSLQTVGQSFELEGVDPSKVGFFLIPDGATLNQGLQQGMDITFRQAANGEWFAVGPNGQDLAGKYDPVLFDNPAFNDAGGDYMIDNAATGNQNWEDIIGGGDKDFDDLNIQADWAPFENDSNRIAEYPLDIEAALTDTDGSETLSITVGGLPEGATLTAGTDNGDGTWTLTPDQLEGLKVRVPVDSDQELELTVTATSTDSDGDINSTSTTVTGEGDVVASDPDLDVADVRGAEDTAIPLDIRAALTDTDGSETLSIAISGVPEGATLSAGTRNADGTWTLAPDQLAGLTVTPPANSDVDFALTVTATSTEQLTGDTAVSTAIFDVAVAGVADAPTVTAEDAVGNEDTAIALDIGAALTDTDGSENLSIKISGVPQGAMLSAGVHNPDGSWTLTPDQLSGLTVTPAHNSNVDFTLTVAATSTEREGSTATTTATIDVDVKGVADTPTLTVALGEGVFTPGGEETPRLTITSVGHDEAGYHNTYGFYIKDENGRPTEGQIVWADVKDSIGDTFTLEGVDPDRVGFFLIPNGDNKNSWLQDGMDVTFRQDASGEWFAVGPNGQDIRGQGDPVLFSDRNLNEFNLDYETDSRTVGNQNWEDIAGGGDRDYDDANFQVEWSTAPGGGGQGQTVFPLDIDAGLTDTDGSETLSITVAGLPAGATLSAGTKNADGSWTLAPAQLDGLTVTVPGNVGDDFSLTVTATTTENDGDTADTTATVDVGVDTIASAPDLDAEDASGTEDTAIPLDIEAALTDTDGSETLSVTISGVPSGALLSAGTNNGDGTWTLTPAQLEGLTVTPAANSDADFALTVTATSTEGSSGDTAETVAIVDVMVAADADAPTLSAADVAGNEDTAIPLDIESALTDTDGSESLSIVISGVPAGAVLSAGTKNADGTWTVQGNQIEGLTVKPPANSDADFSLTVTATSTEANGGDKAATTAIFDVQVNAVADAPTVSATKATGNEDTAIPLDVRAALTDTDGSESLSIKVSGVPSGATLSAGTNNGDGTWTLTPAQLSNLKVTPPANSDADFSLTVTATSTEATSGAATSTAIFDVQVNAVADAPTVTATKAAGNEDAAIPLDVRAALTDTDGSESLSIKISGVPSGATLSAGTKNADGTWTVQPNQLDGLSVRPAANSSTDFALTVTATSTEAAGGSKSSTAIFDVQVAGVADAPTLTASLGQGVVTPGSEEVHTLTVTNMGHSEAGYRNTYGYYVMDDQGRPVSGEIIWRDVKTTEGQTVTIEGVDPDRVGFFLIPNGASLNSGLSDGLDITFRQTSSGNWEAVKPNGQSIAGQSDPVLFSNQALNESNFDYEKNSSAVGNQNWEDLFGGGDKDYDDVNMNVTWSSNGGSEPGTVTYPLIINAALTDTDGSETLSIKVAGLPAEAILSAGTKNADGTWTLTPGQLSGLTVEVPEGSGQLNLVVSATSTEQDGDSMTVSASVSGGAAVDATASAPTLQTSAAQGNEDTAIPLNISAALTDTDGSESLSIVISGVPAGAVLSAGTNNGNGTWTLTPAQIEGLTITPPANSGNDINLTVSAISTESSTGATSTVSADLGVDVIAIADAPTLAAQNASGTEDAAISLNIAAALTDTDGSETLSIMIAGVPAGAVLSAGTKNTDGTWTLTPTQLPGLKITPAQDYTGTFNLTVQAIASEAGTSALSAATIQVTVASDALTPPTVTIQEPGSFDFVGTSGGNTIKGGAGDDVIDGKSGDDKLYGDEAWEISGEGDDIIYGRSGDDTIVGGRGDDTLLGGTGDDVIYGDHTWQTAQDGHDTIVGGSGDNTIVGGGGADLIFAAESTGATSGDGDNVVYGDQKTFYTNADGADTIVGGSGKDTIYGGGGNDTIFGGAGDDKLYGGVKDDYYDSRAGDDYLDGGAGNDTVEGGGGNDTVLGGDGNDVLYGDIAGANWTGGRDTLIGGAGDDTLIGGAGDDILTGGSGKDTFVFNQNSGMDIITDIFNQDKLVFEGQEFDASKLQFSENEQGDVVISFQGVQGTAVTLQGVKAEDLHVNEPDKGYSVSESGGKVTVTIDSIDQNH